MDGILKIFRRETGTKRYLGFVDGIRFLAVFFVVIFHLDAFFGLNFGTFQEGFVGDIIQPLMKHGNRGVDVFFVLSAFILGVNDLSYTNKHGFSQPALIFYKQRFIRIYPPFLCAMTIIFAANVWLTSQYSFSELFPSFLSTITYSNNVISHYFQNPLLCMVTWTLEIEIQFYLVFPVLRWIYKMPVLNKRILLIAGIPVFTFFQILLQPLPLTLFSCFSFFLVGLFLADIYSNSLNQEPNKLGILYMLLSISCFLTLIYMDLSNTSWLYIYPFLLCGFFYFSFKSRQMGVVLGSKWISVIGGMCYSIYLVHTSVISFFNNFLKKWFLIVFESGPLVWILTNLVLVLIASAFFYVFIEKPFMVRRIQN